jgi:hypothetical protein
MGKKINIISGEYGLSFDAIHIEPGVFEPVIWLCKVPDGKTDKDIIYFGYVWNNNDCIVFVPSQDGTIFCNKMWLQSTINQINQIMINFHELMSELSADDYAEIVRIRQKQSEEENNVDDKR